MGEGADVSAGMGAAAGARAWAFGLARRASEPDARWAAVITVAVAVAVLALGSRPLSRGFELDLRQGDTVGGLSQVTLVGFSIVRPFGRVLPDRPGRRDLRIISNRPYPDQFELVIEGWTLRPGQPVELEATLGDARGSARFGADPSTRRIAFANPDAERVLSLALGPDDKLAIQKIAVVEASGAHR